MPKRLKDEEEVKWGWAFGDFPIGIRRFERVAGALVPPGCRLMRMSSVTSPLYFFEEHYLTAHSSRVE